jgi:hypothetical protein
VPSEVTLGQDAGVGAGAATVYTCHMLPRTRVTPWLAIVVASSLLAGCAGDPLPLSRAANDPSNPNAPEAPLPDGSTQLPDMLPPLGISRTGAGLPASAAEHAGHTHQSSAKENNAADAGAVYTCPMHPEVRSNAPGTCPKCGMALVPK